jgi:hypothetical protein
MADNVKKASNSTHILMNWLFFRILVPSHLRSRVKRFRQPLVGRTPKTQTELTYSGAQPQSRLVRSDRSPPESVFLIFRIIIFGEATRLLIGKPIVNCTGNNCRSHLRVGRSGGRQPRFAVRWLQDHRHPVVQLGRDDGEAQQFQRTLLRCAATALSLAMPESTRLRA